MGKVSDYLKSAAMNFVAPPKKMKMNPSKPDAYPTYGSLNQDGEDPILRPKKTGVNILNPAKDADRDISKDKHGCYVPTMTYPLPPVSWEKKQYAKNRRSRNSKNQYL